MSSFPSLVSLPTEVLDSIVILIRRPKHLLSIALTHSVLYRIIIPRHLYRRIIDLMSNRRMWNRVKRTPDHGESARCLSVISVLGQQSLDQLWDPNSTSLTEAIRGMPQLKSLAVQFQILGIDSRTKAFDQAFWEMVGRVCLGLEALHYAGGWSCVQCHDAILGNSANRWSVGSLPRKQPTILCSFCSWNSSGLWPT